MNTQTVKDLRSFGFILGGLFALIFGIAIPLIAQNGYPVWPFALGGTFWLASLIYPKSLRLIYTIWMKIGDVLGYINTRIILGILFFLVFTPIGFTMRAFRADPMGKKFDPSLKSYRVECEEKSPKHMEKPF